MQADQQKSAGDHPYTEKYLSAASSPKVLQLGSCRLFGIIGDKNGRILLLSCPSECHPACACVPSDRDLIHAEKEFAGRAPAMLDANKRGVRCAFPLRHIRLGPARDELDAAYT
jgi:hypothetical protein